MHIKPDVVGGERLILDLFHHRVAPADDLQTLFFRHLRADQVQPFCTFGEGAQYIQPSNYSRHFLQGSKLL